MHVLALGEILDRPDITALGKKFPRILALHNSVAARPSWQKAQAANAG